MFTASVTSTDLISDGLTRAPDRTMLGVQVVPKTRGTLMQVAAIPDAHPVVVALILHFLRPFHQELHGRLAALHSILVPAGRTVLPPSDLRGRGDASFAPCGRTTASAGGDGVGVCDGFLNAGKVCWSVDAARGGGRRVVGWWGGVGEGEARWVYAYEVVVGHGECGARRRGRKNRRAV